MQTFGKTGLVGLLMSSALPQPALSDGNDMSFMDAFLVFAEASGPPSRGTTPDFDEVLLTDDEIYFRPSITLDNGLTFRADINLDPDNSGSDIDESAIFLSGSFGEIVIGDSSATANATIPNVRVSESGWGGCRAGGTDAIRYDAPSFMGFRLSSQFSTDIDKRNRGTLAYDFGGNFINPAAIFDYSLNGAEFSAGAGFCLDNGLTLPTVISLDADIFGYKGSDQINNLNFPNLGITGVGGIPGILINSPTDLQTGYFDVDRHGYGASLNFERPIRINAQGLLEQRVATPSGFFWEPVGAGPSLGVLSLIGGLRYGMEEQTEAVRIMANTPAFGVNSAWNTNYHTQFDTDRLGAYLGLRNTRSYGGRNGATNTLGLTGTLGYDFYDITVRDSVNATGLGGALNYNNIQNHSYDDGLFNASLTASYSWKREKQSFQLSAGIEYGTAPQYDYNRLDSNAAGALSPTLRLKADTQMVFGASWSLQF